VLYRDERGSQPRSRAVPNRLRAGAVVNISTGIGPWSPGGDCPAQITAARVADF